MSFRRKSLASRADDRAGETEAEVGTEETGEREAIWVKDRCKSRADDERRNELADDEVENLDEDRAEETVSFWAGNWTNSRVSWTGEAGEEDDRAEKTIDFRADNETNFQTVKADEVELDHSGQTSFMTRWRVISRSHIRCISFKSSSSLSSFECLVSSWAISLTQVFFWV